jgi:hypothetical protein
MAAILWKTGHAKGKSHTRGGGEKKEAKKMNMVDVILFRNDYRILKSVESTMKRGLR